MIDVTISIVSGGDASLLAACLQSIPRAGAQIAVQTLVVDNRSGGSLDQLMASADGVEWIRNDRMRGFGENHNRALARADGRYLFVLNDDTELDPGCLDRLVRFMDQHRDVGCVGPRLRYPDGRVQPSAFHFPTPGRVALGAVTLQRAGWVESGGEAIRAVDWVNGAAMLIRTDAFRDLGGFDQDFYMYCEDVDLCRRLWDAGYRVAFFPPAGLTHHEYGSSAGVQERRIYQHARSRGLYTRKHHGAAAERGVQTLTAGMFVGRIAASKLMGRDPEERARFAAHVRASLHPAARPAIEDTAAERNQALA